MLSRHTALIGKLTDMGYEECHVSAAGSLAKLVPRCVNCRMVSSPPRKRRASGGPGGAFEALALDARFRGHDENSRSTHVNFCNEVLVRSGTSQYLFYCLFRVKRQVEEFDAHSRYQSQPR